MKAILVPGNGNTDIADNWFPFVKKELERMGVTVIAKNMPDPILARKEYWLPFIKENLSAADAILIGHSSGAVAILRYLEENTARLAILVGVNHTDLGDENERKSGYYNTPWKWNKIRSNAEKIVVFASTDDPFIPIAESRFIKDRVGAEYHEYTDEGHFGADVGKREFPEIVMVVRKFLQKQKTKH